MKRHAGKLIALACGCALWLASVLYQQPGQLHGAREWCRVLSNGALVPGVLFTGVSAIVWISGEGLFDGLKYSLGSLLARMQGQPKRYATYYDYIHREKRAGGAPSPLPGLLFLALAVGLTLLYYAL